MILSKQNSLGLVHWSDSPDRPDLPGVAGVLQAVAQGLATEPVSVIQRIVDVGAAPAPGDADVVLSALRVPDVHVIGAHRHGRPGGAGGERPGQGEVANIILSRSIKFTLFKGSLTWFEDPTDQSMLQ